MNENRNEGGIEQPQTGCVQTGGEAQAGEMRGYIGWVGAASAKVIGLDEKYAKRRVLHAAGSHHSRCHQ